ncbi:acetyl-CoA C-acetyltransferase/acetyl-CoA acyltransferase [Haloferula luteola]|uniref:Acetyl-CoA C-acetyltransferase/acetyl-CoA acyltransferase n=1 Tax=Haloferula luteola TaxID=595692 RepID=A0A840UZ64_9BACT|nr:thiolase family protein [Haloferula luteola]MBB5351035.1 acetyl-CoA C-acetyltransferase/acetyl-CoA acyltransferase [Haloferula luteola]
MAPLYILAGTRTPFARMGTDLEAMDAADLGRHVTSALLTRTGIDPAEISEVIFGCVAQPVDAANVARVIALRAGIPFHVPASTVHRNCASGTEAVTTAAQRAATGQGDLFLVGGTESMSQIPLLFPHAAATKLARFQHAHSAGKKLARLASIKPRDLKPRIGLQLGLTDPFTGKLMGETAELLALEYDISRSEQDAFAAESHRKALNALDSFKREISPVPVHGRAITSDNGIRDDSTPDRLSRLRPLFDAHTGTVTAGNSSQLTDGAVALLVGTEAAAQRLDLEPLGRLSAFAYAGCDPERMGLGPIPAIERLRQQTGLEASRIDLVELNEAFAAQALAVLKELAHPKHSDRPRFEIPPENLNRRGGAIALGHPVGATGARLLLTALDQLHELRAHRALCTLCIGGGQGAALLLER